MQKIKVLALDLEGTLISNAVSQIPRRDLLWFLESCKTLFQRIVIFTAVREQRFREIANSLVAEGLAPDWFARIEYIHWSGKTKNLSFISGVDPFQVLLLDDLEEHVHPGQENQWIGVEDFNYEDPETDFGLGQALEKIESRLKLRELTID